jgi:hypothetical protein
LALVVGIGLPAIGSANFAEFFVVGKGWTAASSLRPLDRIASERGDAVVQKTWTRNAHAKVYNLEVADTHTYLVGREGVLVHNLCAWPSGGNPPLSAYKKAVREAEEKIGGHIGGAGRGKAKYGSPMRSTGFGRKKGYRLDPGHPDKLPGDPEAGPHINWFDWTGGKRGRGGRAGVIPIKWE